MYDPQADEELVLNDRQLIKEVIECIIDEDEVLHKYLEDYATEEGSNYYE